MDGIAYNAALKLCTVLLYNSGFRPEKNLAHFRTLQSLPLILGNKHRENADYLDTCRKKRNETEYDFAANVSEDEELLNFCLELKAECYRLFKILDRSFGKGYPVVFAVTINLHHGRR